MTRSGSQLYADAKPFYHMGFNAYWMPAAVAYGPFFASRADKVLDGAQVGSQTWLVMLRLDITVG